MEPTSIGGNPNPAQVVSAATISTSTALPLDVEKRWRRILQAADKQSNLDRGVYDKFVRQYKDGILAAEGTPNVVSANQTFPFVNVMQSLLYSQNPNIEVEPRLDTGSNEQQFQALVQMGTFPTVDAARELFADTVQKTLTYSYDEAGSERQNNAALFEAIVRGLGWSKCSFDPQRGVDRCDALRRDEVYVDPHARCDVSDANYVSQSCVLPMENAIPFFEELQEFGLDINKIRANYQLTMGTGLEAELAKKNDPSDENDCFKFYEVWSKDRNDRWVDYWDAVHKRHLCRRPWPFALDFDEFPFEHLSFHQQYTQVSDAFPTLLAAAGLMKCYEQSVEYIQRHIARSRAKKILYDKNALTEDMIRAIEDPRDMKSVGINTTDNKGLDQFVRVLDFNAQTDADFNLAASLRGIADSMMGLDELQRGAPQKRLTATQVDVVDEYGQLRVGRFIKSVDEWIARQVRHRAQIARQLITSDTIQRIAGQQAALVWSVGANNPEDLIAEYSIGITAGSTGERAKREKIDRKMRLFDRMAMVNKMQGPTFDLPAVALDIAKLDGEKRAEKYLVPPPPMPMEPPPGEPGTQPPEPIVEAVPDGKGHLEQQRPKEDFTA